MTHLGLVRVLSCAAVKLIAAIQRVVVAQAAATFGSQAGVFGVIFSSAITPPTQGFLRSLQLRFWGSPRTRFTGRRLAAIEFILLMSHSFLEV